MNDPSRTGPPIMRDLELKMIDTPDGVASLDLATVARLADSVNEPALIMKLRNAACINIKRHQPSGNRLRLDTHASLLAQSIRQASIEDTRIAREVKTTQAALSTPSNFSSLGPIARIKALGQPGNDTAGVRPFLHATSDLNIIRQCPESLRSVASGIERYAAFCDILSIRYFPPRTEIVRQWGSVFNTGGTSSLYVSHLKKAFLLLDIPIDWCDS